MEPCHMPALVVYISAAGTPLEATSTMAASFRVFLILSCLLLVSSENASKKYRLEVCGDADVMLDQCSSCCGLEKGCVYLEQGTGSPKCLGSASRSDPRPCPLICEPSRIRVCPNDPFKGIGHIQISVISADKEARKGCHLYDLDSAQEVTLEKDDCLKDAVKICNGIVHPLNHSNCASCCTIDAGCMDLGSGKSVCLSAPSDACPRICGKIAYVCPDKNSYSGVSLDFNSCHTCKKISGGCKLYKRSNGKELCREEEPHIEIA